MLSVSKGVLRRTVRAARNRACFKMTGLTRVQSTTRYISMRAEGLAPLALATQRWRSLQEVFGALSVCGVRLLHQPVTPVVTDIWGRLVE